MILFVGLFVSVLIVVVGTSHVFREAKPISTTASQFSASKSSGQTGKDNLASTEGLDSQDKNSKVQQSTQKKTPQKSELKIFNKQAVSEEFYIKYPYGRVGNFEKASIKKLEQLETQYTLKGVMMLRDESDGQSKHVIVFE